MANIKRIYDNILEEAIDITTHDRNDMYGPPENNFKRIADYWDVHIQHKLELCQQRNELFKIDKYDVPMMMWLFKTAREEYQHNRDSLVDIGGYVNNLGTLRRE